jgi:hypothetical protein
VTREEALAIVRATQPDKYVAWDPATGEPGWQEHDGGPPTLCLDDHFTLDELKAIAYLRERRFQPQHLG